VAVAGFYGRGNFGDDLMAVIVGRALAGLGVPAAIYRLPPSIAGPHGLDARSSAEALLDGAEVLLWGGGGFLVSWNRLLFNILFPGAQQDFTRIVGLARLRGLRLLGLSLGGDGTQPRRLVPSYKERFLEAAEFITVRNPEDLPLLHRYGVPGECYPDIVWQATRWFPASRRTGGRLRIGFDLYPGALLRRGVPQAFSMLRSLARRYPDVDFLFLDTFSRETRPYRGLARFLRGPNISACQFQNMQEDIDLLASLHLLVSSRLHAPMVCLQSGVPVLSFVPEGKSRLMYRSLGLERLCYDRAHIGEFFDLLGSPTRLERFIRDFPFPEVASLRAASEGHLSALRARLLRHS
jgi:hypothetical protein